MLAADYTTLQAMLRSVYAGSPTPRPLVIGPDADLMGDLKDFLKAGPAINVTSFHSSPFFSSCSVADLLSPHTIKLIRAKFNEYVPIHRSYAPRTALWLGEGASDENRIKPDNCTGLHFAASFGYLQMLGALAQAGGKLFMRHTLDTLLSSHDWSPAPVYWVAVLWRRLMGVQVRNATTGSEEVVAFAHASASGSGTAVAAVNLANSTMRLRNPAGIASCTWRSEYILSPTSGLNGVGSALNGVPLVASPAGALPALVPRRVRCSASDAAALPPRTCGFFVYK